MATHAANFATAVWNRVVSWTLSEDLRYKETANQLVHLFATEILGLFQKIALIKLSHLVLMTVAIVSIILACTWGLWRLRVSRYNQFWGLKKSVHFWTSFTTSAQPQYCSSCRKLICGFWIFRNTGWECTVCGRTAHLRCLAACDNFDCKCPSQSEPLRHQLVQGNLPGDSVCCICGIICSSPFGLHGLRCLWCGRTVDENCSKKLSEFCDLGRFHRLLLPPSLVRLSVASPASPFANLSTLFHTHKSRPSQSTTSTISKDQKRHQADVLAEFSTSAQRYMRTMGTQLKEGLSQVQIAMAAGLFEGLKEVTVDVRRLNDLLRREFKRRMRRELQEQELHDRMEQHQQQMPSNNIDTTTPQQLPPPCSTPADVTVADDEEEEERGSATSGPSSVEKEGFREHSSERRRAVPCNGATGMVGHEIDSSEFADHGGVTASVSRVQFSRHAERIKITPRRSLPVDSTITRPCTDRAEVVAEANFLAQEPGRSLQHPRSRLLLSLSTPSLSVKHDASAEAQLAQRMKIGRRNSKKASMSIVVSVLSGSSSGGDDRGNGEDQMRRELPSRTERSSTDAEAQQHTPSLPTYYLNTLGGSDRESPVTFAGTDTRPTLFEKPSKALTEVISQAITSDLKVSTVESFSDKNDNLQSTVPLPPALPPRHPRAPARVIVSSSSSNILTVGDAADSSTPPTTVPINQELRRHRQVMGKAWKDKTEQNINSNSGMVSVISLTSAPFLSSAVVSIAAPAPAAVPVTSADGHRRSSGSLSFAPLIQPAPSVVAEFSSHENVGSRRLLPALQDSGLPQTYPRFSASPTGSDNETRMRYRRHRIRRLEQSRLAAMAVALAARQDKYSDRLFELARLMPARADVWEIVLDVDSTSFRNVATGVSCARDDSSGSHLVVGGKRSHSKSSSARTASSSQINAIGTGGVRIPRILVNACPVLVFVNAKAGGQVGSQLLKEFYKLLNPVQVCDIQTAGGPQSALHLYTRLAMINRLRVLVCGGDGTAGWVINEIQKIYGPPSICHVPVGILPLGTGNDLSRVLGWGASFDGDVQRHLLKVETAQSRLLDLWRIHIVSATSTQSRAAAVPSDTTTTRHSSSPAAPKELLDATFNNYMDIGVAARIALRFHELREAHPELFLSRLGNKFLYGEMGLREWISERTRDISGISIWCDGTLVELPERRIEGLIVVNIPSFSGGVDLWSGQEENVLYSREVAISTSMSAPSLDDPLGLLEHQQRTDSAPISRREREHQSDRRPATCLGMVEGSGDDQYQNREYHSRGRSVRPEFRRNHNRQIDTPYQSNAAEDPSERPLPFPRGYHSGPRSQISDQDFLISHFHSDSSRSRGLLARTRKQSVPTWNGKNLRSRDASDSCHQNEQNRQANQHAEQPEILAGDSYLTSERNGILSDQFRFETAELSDDIWHQNSEYRNCSRSSLSRSRRLIASQKSRYNEMSLSSSRRTNIGRGSKNRFPSHPITPRPPPPHSVPPYAATSYQGYQHAQTPPIMPEKRRNRVIKKRHDSVSGMLNASIDVNKRSARDVSQDSGYFPDESIDGDDRQDRSFSSQSRRRAIPVCRDFVRLDRAATSTECFIPRKWQRQSIRDEMIEVVAIRSLIHLGQVQVGLAEPIKVCQGQHIRIDVPFEVPFQIDGEPRMLPPCSIDITHKGESFVLSPIKSHDDVLLNTVTEVFDEAVKSGILTSLQRIALLRELNKRV